MMSVVERQIAGSRPGAARRAGGSARASTSGACASETCVEPDWSGRCACSQTAPHSAIAAITSGRKSFGCGLVKRIRSMPSTASTARSSSAKPVSISGARSRPYELTFWPSSVTSRTPSAREARHLGEDVARAAAHLASADLRDDAVGADRVAAHRHLHPGLDGTLALRRELGREPALVGGTEGVPGDADAARAEPVAEMRGSSRARRRRRRTGTARRSARAGPPRSSRRRRRPCPGRRRFSARGVAEVRGEALVGLLADRAGVEDEDVGLVLRRRLPEPEVLEQPPDALGVVRVHLASERGDVVELRHRVAAPVSRHDTEE